MQNVKQTHTQTSMHLKRFCAMLNIVHILLELLAQVLFVGQVDSFQLTSILKHLLLCYYFVFGVPSARYFFTPFFQIPNCYDVVIVFFLLLYRVCSFVCCGRLHLLLVLKCIRCNKNCKIYSTEYVVQSHLVFLFVVITRSCYL